VGDLLLLLRSSTGKKLGMLGRHFIFLVRRSWFLRVAECLKLDIKPDSSSGKAGWSQLNHLVSRLGENAQKIYF
jgi:hypothetical protein